MRTEPHARVMRVNHCYKLAIGVALLSNTVFAQSAPGAREHFAHGVELAQRGELDAAAAEFEDAYRISPNYLVLYNVGQAYVGLGRPVEAVQAFEKYLELGGAKIEANRQREVRDLVALNKKRIGHVSLTVDPAGSEIFVDGRSVGDRSGSEPVALAAGTHGVTADAPGYIPFIAHVDIESGKSSVLAIRLERSAQNLSAKIGQLSVGLPVPGTRVLLDGVEAPAASSGPWIVPAGRHEVVCERDGYVPRQSTLEVREGRMASLTCDLRMRSNLPARQAGILSFVVSDPGAEVLIDGHRASATTKLPSGPHRVVIRRQGYENWAEVVMARPGFPQITNVKLRPTPEYAQELAEATRRRRNWAYVLGGAGLSLLATSAVLAISNESRYRDWKSDQASLSRDIQGQHWSSTLDARSDDLQSRAASIQGRDDLAIGVAALGGGVLGYAAISWLYTPR